MRDARGVAAPLGAPVALQAAALAEAARPEAPALEPRDAEVKAADAGTDLASLDLDSIVLQRQRMVADLNTERARLAADNDQGQHNKTLELIDSRIQRLALLEDVVRSSLDIYSSVVRGHNATEMDVVMETENLMLIDKFQNLVLRAKNDHLAIVENKKNMDKNAKKLEAEHAKQKQEQQPGIVGDVMKDVANEADRLESNLKGDSFKESQKLKDTTVETVLKVEDPKNNSTAKNAGEKAAPVLIDSQNNQYVLSKSGDATAHVEDTRLLNDILLLLVTCFACATIFHVLRMPSFFGYLLAGVLLGPPGYIKNAVQVETISRGLGVIFIMFFLGLEFNFSRIKRVWSASIIGSAVPFMLITVGAIMVGNQLGSKPAESLVVGASLSLSSTVVVLSFLKTNESETVYGRTIVGILIAQDVLLGFLLALMPALEKSGMEALFTALRLIGWLLVFLLGCAVGASPITRLLQWLLPTRGSGQEVYLLANIGLCLLVIYFGSLCDQSLELCCFVAGVMVATRKNVADATIHVVEPLRGMFSALFFASIGLHIYPSFLVNEGGLLIILTTLTVVAKVVISTLVLKAILGFRWTTSITASVGLGQISEFTFVFASKAKSLHILSRETFYLLLGVTTLSLLVSPALWHITSYFDGRRRAGDAGFKRTASDLEYQALADE
nr:Transmembrane and coiled-coil domains-containing protein 3 [Polyrhizophydium stewartii]